MEIWQMWRAEALRQGVDPELAQLGYEVLRDHYQHGRNEIPADGTWCLGGYPELMVQAALQCPAKAFLEFNATLALAGPPELDAEEVAMDLLSTKLGSWHRADEQLWREEPIWQELVKAIVHTA